MARPTPRDVEVVLGLDDDEDEEALRRRAAHALGVPMTAVPSARITRRAIDARGGRVRFRVTLSLDEAPAPETLGTPLPRDVRAPRAAGDVGGDAAPVVIVGDGPAGLFCAYELARAGIASVVLDRGKTVQPRRVDLKGLNQLGVVDADSNYCFGEGGAGTYSDGKLYTRSTKRGDVRDVLETLALHGAPVDILTDARPHIGSNLLPKVITAMRERLEACGVRVLFGKRVVRLVVAGPPGNARVRGVVCADGDEIRGSAVVLATGHSARDVYAMLHAQHIALEAKPLAMGVRIEHPQPLIDRIQYGKSAGHVKLPAASYRIVENVDGRGVFSFCMCPGGFIVPASTDAACLVVNGMSLKRRDSPFANSGLVVSVELADANAAGHNGPFALLEVQRRIEEAARTAGLAGNAPLSSDGSVSARTGLRAPAVRARDFLQKRGSNDVPATSYQPGLVPADLDAVLDAAGVPIAAKLRAALEVFGQQMRGYATNEAVLVGVETRTSAPLRVPREDTTLASPDVAGLYPCGEGAGYAGGIISAALDGIRVAHAIAGAVRSAT